MFMLAPRVWKLNFQSSLGRRATNVHCYESLTSSHHFCMSLHLLLSFRRSDLATSLLLLANPLFLTAAMYQLPHCAPELAQPSVGL